MSDPASWLMIEPGWQVYASDDVEVGFITEVAGDSNFDVFDGIVVGSGPFGKPRYVPSELVDTIVEGRVNLRIPSDEFERQGEHEQPPPSAVIQPESAYAAEPVAAPNPSRSQGVPLRTRLSAWLRSRRSR